MKRLIALILCLAFFLPAGNAYAKSEEREEFTSGYFKYVILDDGTAEIVRYSGPDEKLTIPDHLDGYEVASIGNGAFQNRPNLTSITIPDSVINIGANPFASCLDLTSIIVSPDHPTLATIDGVLFSKEDRRLVCYPYAFSAGAYSIPDGIRAIGDSAFLGCLSLTSVTIPDSVTSIGVRAFSFCNHLASITIPDSVTSIGDETFFECLSLTSVTIPDSVTSIGVRAFRNCKRLASITIPDSVMSIGDSAFSGCESLTSVTIPDSVTSIGANPFAYCDKLTSIIVSPDHPTLATIDGVLFSKEDKRLVCYPCEFTAGAYSIPDGIRAIGDSAFSGCESLTSVTIPDSVTSIGDSAFSWCESLTSVTIPDNVTSIGDSAFSGCESLTSVTIPDSVTSIGNSAFKKCEILKSITIPDSVTSIGEDVFYGCSDHLTITVDRDSYASEYCKANNLNYTYPDINDWLKD